MAGIVVGIKNVLRGLCLDDETSGATKAHSGKARNQNIFTKSHAFIIAFWVGGCKIFWFVIYRGAEDGVGVVFKNVVRRKEGLWKSLILITS